MPKRAKIKDSNITTVIPTDPVSTLKEMSRHFDRCVDNIMNLATGLDRYELGYKHAFSNRFLNDVDRILEKKDIASARRKAIIKAIDKNNFSGLSEEEQKLADNTVHANALSSIFTFPGLISSELDKAESSKKENSAYRSLSYDSILYSTFKGILSAISQDLVLNKIENEPYVRSNMTDLLKHCPDILKAGNDYKKVDAAVHPKKEEKSSEHKVLGPYTAKESLRTSALGGLARKAAPEEIILEGKREVLRSSQRSNSSIHSTR